MKTVPPLNDLFNRAGLNFLTYLKGEQHASKEDDDIQVMEKDSKEPKA